MAYSACTTSQIRASALGSLSTDTSGAFIPDGPVLEGAPSGPLHGLTFAAKDLYDVRNSMSANAALHPTAASPPAGLHHAEGRL